MEKADVARSSFVGMDRVALLWLLLTGEVPTKQQTDALSAELRKREAVPQEVTNLMKSIPKYVRGPVCLCVVGGSEAEGSWPCRR